jgi:3-oxoacyl-[acyl-carrier protein] reductase
MELKGKTAVVTGASRGIGAATSILLAQRGVSRVVMHYNSYQQGAEEARDAVRKAGAEAELIQSDLSTNQGIRTLASELKRVAPRTDILVNNAGHLVARAKLPEMSEELYDQIMNLNVKSMWFVSQAVVPYMMEQKSGVIINLSSIAARNGGGPGATMYAASKAAVSTITKGMAKELAPLGIRVNAVSPGTVDNYFHEKHSTPQMLASMLASAPAGRLGTNEDIAEAIVWLCSDASSYIHGQTIEINGGMYMP